MLLKTNVEKMSLLGLDTMLMKTSQLQPFYHDVDEKEGDSRRAEIHAPRVFTSLLIPHFGLRRLDAALK